MREVVTAYSEVLVSLQRAQMLQPLIPHKGNKVSMKNFLSFGLGTEKHGSVLSECLTLGKSTHLSGPQLPNLKYG